MSTETLRPNAAGAYCQISNETGCSVCPNHYDCVDEVVTDDSATFVRNQWTGTADTDTYALPNHSEGGGTINHVTVYVRLSENGVVAGSWAKVTIYTHSILHYGSEILPAAIANWTSFSNHSKQWATNPETSEPWTWAEIDALEAGITLKAIDNQIMCTQVYVEIDYTEVTTHTIVASAGANGIIEPSGNVAVNDGDDQLFTMTPDTGYEMDEIIVDGNPI